MANDTTAKTTNSTTYDNRNRYEHENIVANEPTVNANKMLPSSSMSNDHTNVLATKTTSHISFDKLIELLDSESKRIREWNTRSTVDAMRLLRLCGGGEQGINNGTTGWGSPPTAPSTAPGKYTCFLVIKSITVKNSFRSTNMSITHKVIVNVSGGGNASTSTWGSAQPPQQQWDQPSGSNAAVNVNATNANVGQNATMWPSAAGTNPGKCIENECCSGVNAIPRFIKKMY